MGSKRYRNHGVSKPRAVSPRHGQQTDDEDVFAQVAITFSESEGEPGIDVCCVGLVSDAEAAFLVREAGKALAALALSASAAELSESEASVRPHRHWQPVEADASA